MLSREDKQAIIKLYEDRYAENGYDVRTLGWRGHEDQALRFQVLCDIGDMSGTSVCDVGCGFGDLVGYLSKRFTSVAYTGIDISPSLVEQALLLHPEHRFMCADILENEFAERADYFVLSGALNFLVEDNFRLTSEMISRMFHLAERGVAVNFLTEYVNYKQPHNYHHSPEEVFRFARTLTKWVTLRHDYPLWEFTIFLYKAPQS